MEGNNIGTIVTNEAYGGPSSNEGLKAYFSLLAACPGVVEQALALAADRAKFAEINGGSPTPGDNTNSAA